jgi:hypothetical protein
VVQGAPAVKDEQTTPPEPSGVAAVTEKKEARIAD